MNIRREENTKQVWKWIIKCPACGVDLGVSEKHVKINTRGQPFITCHNYAGHKKNGPFSFILSFASIRTDPELLKLVKEERISHGFIGEPKDRFKEWEEERRRKRDAGPKIIGL
jgi:hypothetical protein